MNQTFRTSRGHCQLSETHLFFIDENAFEEAVNNSRQTEHDKRKAGLSLILILAPIVLVVQTLLGNFSIELFLFIVGILSINIISLIFLNGLTFENKMVKDRIVKCECRNFLFGLTPTYLLTYYREKGGKVQRRIDKLSPLSSKELVYISEVKSILMDAGLMNKSAINEV